jgi:hypothetical protein
VDQCAEISELAERQANESLAIVVIEGLRRQLALRRTGLNLAVEIEGRRTSVIQDLEAGARRDSVDDVALGIVTLGTRARD